MAKYFTIEELGGGDGPYFYSVRELRAKLSEMPEVQTVQRWWWSGNDLIECEDVSREMIMQTKARRLTSGATMKWSIEHR